MSLAGRKQTPEHVRKRTEAMLKTRSMWTDEQKAQAIEKNRKGHLGQIPWCAGKKNPQLSRENHWNWGNNMPLESIEKMRKSLTGKKQTPALVKKRVDARAGYSHSEETKEKIGKANAGENNGMFGRCGELSSTWRGGISFEPYPLTWTFSLREMIRNRDNRKCCICGVQEGKQRHDVHHIDYNKGNICPENLITLCVPCHRKTNSKREYWIAILRNVQSSRFANNAAI